MDSIKVSDPHVYDEQQLVQAAANGNYEKVLQLLNSCVSVDAKEYNKLLFYALKNYYTPLQVAAANGHDKCLQILIERGGNVNAKDRFDVTALHMAAEKGHTLCVKALLDARAYSSVPSKCIKLSYSRAVPYLAGTTPLHLAAANNHVDCVKELVQYGADCNAVNKTGHTSLYIACKYGFSECVLAHLKSAFRKNILSLPSFDTADTPLHFAVTHGMTECVKELLHLGSDVNHINFAGYSPLHLALSKSTGRIRRQIEIIKLLVLEGYNTDINYPDSRGFTPLHYVCFNGYRNMWVRRPELAKFLMAFGADINIRNHQGFTLLENELRTYGENSEIISYLINCMPQIPHSICLNSFQLDHERDLSDMVTREFFRGPFENPIAEIAFLYRIAAQHENIRRAAQHEGLPDDDSDDDVRVIGGHEPSPRMGFMMHPQMDELEQRHARQILNVLANADHRDIRNRPVVLNQQEWYEEIASNPCPLQHQCRYVIRTYMGAKKLKNIKKLPIPNKLKAYLLFESDKTVIEKKKFPTF